MRPLLIAIVRSNGYQYPEECKGQQYHNAYEAGAVYSIQTVGGYQQDYSKGSVQKPFHFSALNMVD